MSSFSRKTVVDVKTKSWYDGTVSVILSANGAELNIQNYNTMIAHLKTENSGGVSPTLDIHFQTKMPNGDWVDIPDMVFAQAVGNTEEVITNVIGILGTYRELGQIIRPVFAITGTDPTFDITFDVILKS